MKTRLRRFNRQSGSARRKAATFAKLMEARDKAYPRIPETFAILLEATLRKGVPDAS